VTRYPPLDDEIVARLQEAIAGGRFPGVELEHAMKLALTDGIIPASGLPVDSVLALDDWLRALKARHEVAGDDRDGVDGS